MAHLPDARSVNQTDARITIPRPARQILSVRCGLSLFGPATRPVELLGEATGCLMFVKAWSVNGSRASGRGRFEPPEERAETGRPSLRSLKIVKSFAEGLTGLQRMNYHNIERWWPLRSHKFCRNKPSPHVGKPVCRQGVFGASSPAIVANPESRRALSITPSGKGTYPCESGVSSPSGQRSEGCATRART